ncbi:MAG: 2OG-Fe(II) oxygenase [Lautropia sp.]|nr:2OG-Fe(II) oxygenase [Lautropia sp.]
MNELAPGNEQPAEPTAAPGITRLSASWQDWLTTNVMRGCADADMTKVMVENGFDPTFSIHAIGIVRSMSERVKGEVGAALGTDFKVEPIRLPAGARVRAHDRDVNIVFTLNNPNVAVIDGLLSEAECDKLMQLTNGRMKSSQVVDRKSGGSYESHVRKSEGCHFNRGENAVVQRVEQRIAALTGVPVDCGEPLQMLHYGLGGEYLAHQDFFDPADPGSPVLTKVGGQRIATLVIYLNNVPEGGDTNFPELELSVKPRKGSAVYFEYLNAAGQLDTRCLHAGTPVAKGDKWIATKWLRQRPYVGT